MVSVLALDTGTRNFYPLENTRAGKQNGMNNEKVFGMSFSKIYPLLVSKARKKGRTLEDVNQVITWLTGYTPEEIEKAAAGSVTYRDFFRNAPQLNPNRKRITGVVCGVQVEAIEEPLMQEIRYLDKLIDELAKGKAMEKILRGQEQIREEAIKTNGKTYLFDAVIEPVPDKGGAYVRFPYDIRKEFGKGRVKAEITFDGEPYSGSIVNMGIKNEDGSVCYIIGVRKAIREKIGKQPGDTVKVSVKAVI